MRIGSGFPVDKDRLKSKKRGRGASVGSPSSFSAVLEESVASEYENSIEELMSDLKDQEKSLLDSQSLVDLQKYKKSIQQLLELITSEGFETKTFQRKRSANRADFFIVKKINEKLFQLASSLTSPQNRAFSLVKECEEIRGLIFDLLH